MAIGFNHVILYNFYYCGIFFLFAKNSYLGGLWGHGGLQTASVALEVTLDIMFDTINLNYPGIYSQFPFNVYKVPVPPFVYLHLRVKFHSGRNSKYRGTGTL